MVDIELIRSKLTSGSYVGLRDQREFIKWAIKSGRDNNNIINYFDKYGGFNKAQFEFMLNDLRANI